MGRSLWNLQLFFGGYKRTDGISFKGFCNQRKEICRETCEQLAKFQPRAILSPLSYQPRNGFITEILGDVFSAGSHSSRHTPTLCPSGVDCYVQVLVFEKLHLYRLKPNLPTWSAPRRRNSLPPAKPEVLGLSQKAVATRRWKERKRESNSTFIILLNLNHLFL